MRAKIENSSDLLLLPSLPFCIIFYSSLYLSSSFCGNEMLSQLSASFLNTLIHYKCYQSQCFPLGKEKSWQTLVMLLQACMPVLSLHIFTVFPNCVCFTCTDPSGNITSSTPEKHHLIWSSYVNEKIMTELLRQVWLHTLVKMKVLYCWQWFHVETLTFPLQKRVFILEKVRQIIQIFTLRKKWFFLRSVHWKVLWEPQMDLLLHHYENTPLEPLFLRVYSDPKKYLDILSTLINVWMSLHYIT